MERKEDEGIVDARSYRYEPVAVYAGGIAAVEGSARTLARGFGEGCISRRAGNTK